MVEVINVGKNDIFMFEVDVGNMPPQKVKTYLESVKSGFQDVCENKSFFIATSGPGIRGTKLTILKRD